MHGMFFFPTGPFPASLGPRTKSKLAVDEAFGYLAQDLLDRNFTKCVYFTDVYGRPSTVQGHIFYGMYGSLKVLSQGAKLAMKKVSHSKTALLVVFGSICVYSSLSFRVIARQFNLAEFCVKK